MSEEHFGLKGEPITFEEWGVIRRSGDGRIGDDTVGTRRVSTIWVGINMGNAYGPLDVCETMVFADGKILDGERYSTAADAREGHARWVARIRGGL